MVDPSKLLGGCIVWVNVCMGMVLALWCVYILCWCTTVVVFRTCDMPVSSLRDMGEAISLTQTGQACNHMCTYIQYVRTYTHAPVSMVHTYSVHTV